MAGMDIRVQNSDLAHVLADPAGLMAPVFVPESDTPALEHVLTRTHTHTHTEGVSGTVRPEGQGLIHGHLGKCCVKRKK